MGDGRIGAAAIPITMRIASLSLLLVGLAAACATPKGGKPDWTVYADCSAAYRVNARIADPSRPASMTSMVSETADDYQKAAVERFRQQPHPSHDYPMTEPLPGSQTGHVDRSSAGIIFAVTARVVETIGKFTNLPREEVEKFIDACPQPD